MATETGRTVAIVATPRGVEEVRARLAQAGVPQAQVEVAELKFRRTVDLGERAPLEVVSRHLALGAGLLGATGLLVAGACDELGLDLLLAGAGGAVIGAVLGLGVSVGLQLRDSRSSATTERRFWKVRVEGDATLIARARGLASRTGRTLSRVVTGAFEVKPRDR